MFLYIYNILLYKCFKEIKVPFWSKDVLKLFFQLPSYLNAKKNNHNFWINTRQNLNHQACKNQQILIFEKLKILVQVKNKKIKIIILLISEIEDILNLKIVSALTCML